MTAQPHTTTEYENTLYKEDAHHSSIFTIINQIISKIKIGQDLTLFSLPARFFVPYSLLEKFISPMKRGFILFDTLDSHHDPINRFLIVVKWLIGSIFEEKEWAKKPLNPILGETFRCKMEHTNGTTTDIYSEQVSHHPPITAFYVHNSKLNISIYGGVQQKLKFTGNSVQVELSGSQSVYLHEYNEKYTYAMPSLAVHGFIFGEKHTEWVGDVKVICEKTNLEASIEFCKKGYFFGSWDLIKGTIKNTSTGQILHTLKGSWKSKVTIDDPQIQVKKMDWDFTHLQIEEAIIPPEVEWDETYSRKVWAHVMTAIKEENFSAANKSKHEIEQREREKAKERKEKQIQYQSKIFIKDGDTWIPIELKKQIENPTNN